MLILSLRTDKPDAEIGLHAGQTLVAHHTWVAHRKLAETLHSEIASLLSAQNKSWNDIEAIVAYTGPGSFTGLRIGLSVANALASSNSILIIGTSGEDWLKQGIAKLLNGEGQNTAMPEYGAPVHITKPKK